jgi:hypothetical protein
MTVDELLRELETKNSAIDVLNRDMGTLLADLRAQVGGGTPGPEPPEPEPEPEPPYETVRTAAELENALNAGGKYDLVPGTYIGRWDIKVPNTVLRGVQLPVARVQPGQTANVTLKSSAPTVPALRITADHVRVEGITFLQGSKDTVVVLVGSSTATDPSQQPDDVVLDRIEVVAPEATGGWRGVEAHTRSFALLRSRVTGFWYQNRQSQGYWTCNGPGPYLISDNHIEASGENILFGGGTIVNESMHPANAHILGNTLLKPATWRTKGGSVCNSLEFKAMKTALVEHNTLDGCWKDVQPGNMIVLTPRNQYNNSPWTVVKNITIRHNTTRNHTHEFAVSILLEDNNAPSQRTEDITIEGNLFEDSPKGIQIVRGLVGQLRVTNNTWPKMKWNLMAFDGDYATTWVKPVLVFRDNVTYSGAYGVSGKNTSPGVPTLDAFMVKPYDFTGNIIEKTELRTIPWPPNNTLLAPGTLAAKLSADYKYLPDSSKGY